MAKPIIIAITGMPASGKTTCADYIARKKGVERIKLSDYIWGWLEEQGIKKSGVTGAMFGLFLHTIYSDTPLLRWTKKEIKKHKGAKVILLDSLRTLKGYYKFKKKYDKHFALIAVVAKPSLREEREIKRARFGSSTTERSFLMRDTEELKIGLGSVIAMADEYIDANVSKREMLSQLSSVYARLARELK